MSRTSRLVVRAILTVAIPLVAAAACDSPTMPVARQSVRPATVPALHDQILGDTLSCKSGWQVINGYYVCN